ncbi:uncharacterized protein [Danio rerio]|uniref:Uncharacterized protein n=1 Tax=Danio rerio TaxID=7955 RepID=A0AC58HPH8_DANRE
MALFSSAFKKLFDCFIPFWHRRETQQCAAQELAAVNKCSESEACNFTANPNKCRKKRRKGAKREVKALQTPARPSVLKPIKGKLPKLPSDSGDFILPAARFKPLPPVKIPQMCAVEGSEQEFVLPGCPFNLDPPKLLAVPLHPVPAPDELFSTVCPIPPPRAPLRSVCSLSSLQSQSSGSAWSVSASELMFSDTEDEESEFGETIQTFLEPERCQRQMIAREEEEEEEEVLDDESWTSEVFEFEDLSEAGHSEAEHDMTSLFCVSPADGAESKLSENVPEQPKTKRKVQMNLFTRAEEKVKGMWRGISRRRGREEKESCCTSVTEMILN